MKLEFRDSRKVSLFIKGFKVLSEHNFLALGALVPIFALVPGIIDEAFAAFTVLILGFGAIMLRSYIVRNRERIIANLEQSRERGTLEPIEFREALRNLNSVTVDR